MSSYKSNLQNFDYKQGLIYFPPNKGHVLNTLFLLMASEKTGIFGALGSVLGYIGAEIATEKILSGLLWPQRAYFNITWRSIPILALSPMGGPLHSVVLKSLDVIFKHKLFYGEKIGHMLGTAFYEDQKWEFTVRSKNGITSQPESSRNCLWVRTLRQIPIPDLQDKQPSGDTEKCTGKTQSVRAKVSVIHLTISKATNEDKGKKDIPFIQEDTGIPEWRVFAAITISESSAIIIAICLASVLRSLWAVWWLSPLFLRLFSACFTLKREKLITLDDDSLEQPCSQFEIQCPQSEGNFMLISGPENVVRQFFTHYGHPERHRIREIVQLIIVIIFGCLFPAGLFCSLIWMPLEIQYVWLCHQVFVCFLMLVVRYSHAGTYTSTEARIARHFSNADTRETNNNNGKEPMILFGHSRNGSETVKVGFAATYHFRYRDAKKCMEDLLKRELER